MSKTSHILISIVAVMNVLIFASPSLSKDDCNKDLDAFLACNNPIVIKYLKALTIDDIGNVLKGVRMTDGSMVLQSYTFLGKAKGVAKGVHIYIVESKNRKEAYLWADEKRAEILLPRCSKDVSSESAYALSGDVYTWNRLHAGFGVVHAMCIDPLWITK